MSGTEDHSAMEHASGIRSEAQEKHSINSATPIEQAREHCYSFMREGEEELAAIDALIEAVRLASAPPQQQVSTYTLLTEVKALASKGYRHLDADEESKALKVLSALAGVPGCYPALDALYRKVETNLPAPPQPGEEQP